MPKPSWQPHATDRYFDTRTDGIKLVVFETQFDSYSYSVLKEDEIETAGNLAGVPREEAQARAEEIAGEF